MRVLGFSKRWQKLSNPEFSTFRYPRMDRDWGVGEVVQVVIQPRRKGGGDKLGCAEIINNEVRELDAQYFEMVKGDCPPLVTDVEAQADGFAGLDDMITWMEKTYGRLDWMSRMNKLTLTWQRVEDV